MRVDSNICVGLSSDRTLFDSTNLRATYEWLVGRMEQLGLPIHRIGIKGPGFVRKYEDFDSVNRRIEVADFAQIHSIEFCNLREQWTNEWDDWKVTGGIALRRHLRTWRAYWVFRPALTGQDIPTVNHHLLEFAGHTVQRYGFIFQLCAVRAALGLAMGMGYNEPPAANKEESTNAGYWASYADLLADKLLLRGVYEINLLSRPYLDLPVHGTTLERWIMQDDTRGTLGPLEGNDRITVWTPTAEQIPIIREELYRAGILFYWRHFDSSDAQRRDFSKPFVPSDLIPKIFRSNYCHTTDPPTDKR